MRYLLCYDGSPDGTKALTHLCKLLKDDDYVVMFAATEASRSRMKELGIRKEDRPSSSSDQEREIRRVMYNLLQSATKTLKDAGAKNTKMVLVETSDVRRTALDIAKQEDVDMIVLGQKGKSGFKRMFVGSTAQYIVQRAPVPVLIVRGDVPIEIDDKDTDDVVWYQVSEDNFNLVYDENRPATYAASSTNFDREVPRPSYPVTAEKETKTEIKQRVYEPVMEKDVERLSPGKHHHHQSDHTKKVTVETKEKVDTGDRKKVTVEHH